MVARIIAAVVLVFIVHVTLVAQRDSRLARIDAFINAKHKYHNFNGNVLVAENGRIIYQRSVGFADRQTRRALTSESVFNLASISKQFTAAAIMLCRERNLLNLDDPLSKYLPEVPYEGINLRQLLTHTSGLPEQNELLYKHWNSEKPVTNRDMLEYLVKYKPPIAFKPGESFKYCNTNYSLLALIVERVSGQTFQQFITGNFFAPLKLRHTQFLQPGKPIPNQTENYIFDPETKQFLPPQQIPQWQKAVPLTGLVGAGNIHATIGDLLLWQESLSEATILTRESIREMETPHVQANVDGSDAYGFGLAIKSIYDDTKIFHYGGTLGYWNSLQHYKKTNRTIIVLTNNESEKGLTNAIAAILFNQPVALPSLYKETTLSAKQLNRFVGTYQAPNGSSFSIENRNGKLFRVVAGGAPRELKTASRSKLFYDDESDRQIEFVFDNGVKAVRFISQGLVTELKKVE